MKIIVLTDDEHRTLLWMASQALDTLSPSAQQKDGTPLRPVWESVREKVAEAK